MNRLTSEQPVTKFADFCEKVSFSVALQPATLYLAVKTLKEMSYTNVTDLDGGSKAWEAAGLPVEKQ